MTAAEAAGRVVAGIVRRGPDQELLVQVHPCCAAHAHNRGAPCWAAVEALHRSGGGQRRWWVTPGKMLISSQREFDAVHRVRAIEKSLLRFLLKPELLAPIGLYYENPEVRRSLWPEQAAQPAFINYLRSLYDETQLEAIEMAACHLGAPDADAPGASSSKGASHPLMPFVLIQGPPGTGKTHTVKGMLNVWHLVAYQRYYDGLISATGGSQHSNHHRPAAQLNAMGSNIVDVVSSSMLSDLGRAVEQVGLWRPDALSLWSCTTSIRLPILPPSARTLHATLLAAACRSTPHRRPSRASSSARPPTPPAMSCSHAS
jgi:senataxin